MIRTRTRYTDSGATLTEIETEEGDVITRLTDAEGNLLEAAIDMWNQGYHTVVRMPTTFLPT